MQANRSLETRLYQQSIKLVGTYSQSKMRMNRVSILLRVLFAALEYVGYTATFFALMSIRVLPDYPAVDRLNPVEWVKHVAVFKDYMLLLFIILAIHTFLVLQGKLFSGKAERSLVDEYMFTLRSILLSFLISIGITFLLKTTFLYSRVTLVVFIASMMTEAVVWRSMYALTVRTLQRKGLLVKRVLIVGAGKIGTEIANGISGSRQNGYRIVGFLDDYKTGSDILGTTIDLENIIQRERIDIIYITIPSERTIVDNALHGIYKYNIDIRIIPERFDRIATTFTYRNDLDYPCMQIVKTPLRGINILVKRVSDIVGSIILLLLLSPIFATIACLIKFDSEGPVFFRQTRIGKNGIPFHMVKFRSMHREAERMKASLEEKSEASGPVFKMKNDPRITRIGRFLRKYSVDELPQLWNVLKGEMSLIGPRPPLPNEVEQYTSYHWRRMDVLPGMTGLWQVSGRSDISFDEWVDLDIFYIEQWSFSLEMKILFKTIPVVLKGSGAY